MCHIHKGSINYIYIFILFCMNILEQAIFIMLHYMQISNKNKNSFLQTLSVFKYISQHNNQLPQYRINSASR
jgi:hypothetical protein